MSRNIGLFSFFWVLCSFVVSGTVISQAESWGLVQSKEITMKHRNNWTPTNFRQRKRRSTLSEMWSFSAAISHSRPRLTLSEMLASNNIHFVTKGIRAAGYEDRSAGQLLNVMWLSVVSLPLGKLCHAASRASVTRTPAEGVVPTVLPEDRDGTKDRFGRLNHKLIFHFNIVMET